MRIGAGIIACLGLLVLISADPVSAQILRNEAYVGEPFGVARIVIPRRQDDDSTRVLTNGFGLSEKDQRALYPVFTSGVASGLLRRALGADGTSGGGPLTLYFLFRGEEPLELRVTASDTTSLRIRPERFPRGHTRLLRAWWRNYSTAAQQQTQRSDYPPLVETYLTTVLGQRLGLDPPLLGRLLSSESPGLIGNPSLRLLLNVESLRTESLRESLKRTASDRETADLPVPDEIAWSKSEISAAVEGIDLEPIARHVPEECFYVRFGSFDNYLWLRGLMDEYGGDISRMVTARGHDARLSQRLEDQLGLKETALAKLFGGQVISDVAIIGRDPYVQEGAAIGILFESRNRSLLENDLQRQRREATERVADNGAEIRQVEVGGQTVSLAATPDNRLRSFYAAHEDYHLVTNSRALVERFLETGQGIRPLTQTPEFRLARQTMPLSREDTVFVYLSPAFFQGLMAPQYQIELRRRLRAVTDLEVFEMARWVARVEQRDESLSELVRAGLLPADVESRSDGSRPIERRGQWVDSLRGARGAFLPIPDVPLEKVTARERATYQATVNFHQAQWDQMDPLMIALKRFTVEEPSRERLRIEARMVPFDRRKYGLVTSLVGPASQIQLRPAEQDILSVQLLVQGGLLQPNVEPHLVFLGLRDTEVPLSLGRPSLLRNLMLVRMAPAYLGAWPQLGLLDLLPLGSPIDAQGYSQYPLGLWRRQTAEGFSVLSFDPAILESTVPQLALERSDHHAQIRIRIGDLSQAKIRPWLNALRYQRSYDTSVGNTRLFQTISQQLGVPPAQAKDVAEAILGVDLICTLGGEYQLQDGTGESPYWVSTAWSEAPATSDGDAVSAPEFTSPLLQWFRGMEADVLMLDDRVIAYSTVDLQRQTKPDQNEVKLPLFDFFRDNPFKRKDKDLTPAEEEPFEELPPPPPIPEGAVPLKR